MSIQHGKMTVITGVSGSGKSSLAYDTLYAEGHRKYVESLSSYARQFIERLPKPPVDYIKGLSPCIALEQKVSTSNPRSTVGTATEIYDYLRVLFARIGKIIHPTSGKEIKRHYPQDVLNFIQTLEPETLIFICNQIAITTDFLKDIDFLAQSGFSRLLINNKIHKIADLLNSSLMVTAKDNCFLIIDRMVAYANFDEDTISRLTDSIETAFHQGAGNCFVVWQKNSTSGIEKFTHILEADGITFEDPSPQLFAFNNPYGICQYCKGIGKTFDFAQNKIFADKNKSIKKGGVPSVIYDLIIKQKKIPTQYQYLLECPLNELSDKEMDFLWRGIESNSSFKGIYQWLKEYESLHAQWNYYNKGTIVSHFKSHTSCNECKGSRLRKEALYVKILDKDIAQLCEIPINELHDFFQHEINIKLENKHYVERLLQEIISRLKFLCDVGLEYLNLNREMRTLSGGETQRIFLTTSLGSSLTGSIYILDEPTTGLHPRDTDRLISVLKKLKAEGNTVVLVEHDEEVMKNADCIIDMGPLAGKNGGVVVFQGAYNDLTETQSSITADYLLKRKEIKWPVNKRKSSDFIYFENANSNNLQNISVQFPFNALTCITGVSGSGKSTLVEQEIVPEFEKITIHRQASEKLKGASGKIKQVHFINQNSVSTSTRSNCATYTKVYDHIRGLFSRYSKLQGIPLDAGFFSFNVPGGRCEVCQGEGIVRIPMQFMADIEMTCEDCKGQRFSKEVLNVKYYDKNISDILEMTIDEAHDLFSKEVQYADLKKIILHTLNVLKAVGLGYVPMGQSTSKMSGGELQRLKIASYLLEEKDNVSKLFILDEPTTGLHIHDIGILMKAIDALIQKGNTVLIIEHHPDVIKCADWVIDLGPDGGKNGGKIVFQGLPEDLINVKASYTGKYLKLKR